VGSDAGYAKTHPESLIVPLVTIVCTVGDLAPLVASDVRHRADSTLDALTGLLNRRRMPARFAEVAGQAAIAHQPKRSGRRREEHLARVADTVSDREARAAARASRIGHRAAGWRP
jgi:hypothetical protein